MASQKMQSFGTRLGPNAIKIGSDGLYVSDERLQGKKALLFIVQEWCGHCRNLAADAKQAQSSGLVACYMTGDDEASKRCFEAMNVYGFPTIFVVMPNGKLIDYNGGRSAQELANAARGGSSQSGGSSWWSMFFE